MSKHLHHDQILNQYASDSGIEFYQHVMGGGEPVIHYGIYQDLSEDIITATKATTLTLLEYAQSHLKHPPKKILELGSGLGGSAHILAKKTSSQITCVDLCSRFNENNNRVANELDIAKQITTWTGSYEELPMEWSGTFDLVWSQEALCHAYDRKQVFSEAYRCLKPNGLMAFSDIMLSEKVTEEQAATYSSVNAISKWSNLDETLKDLISSGFSENHHQDWSEHLHTNFKQMLRQIELHRETMLDRGVDKDFIESFETSLTQRLNWSTGEVLCWYAFIATK